MTENRIPTEQELDTMLEQAPRFDLDAVKRRTLSRIEGEPARPARKLAPMRSFFIAAVICALSVSALAATDYATGGRIAKVLGIQKPQTEEASNSLPEPETEPEPQLPEETAAPLPEPAQEPEVPEEEPPELDEQLAGALQIQPTQAEKLRPAVQAVEQTTENQDVRMTVLQTLGDPSCIYVKLRFNFSNNISAEGETEFDKMDFSLSQARSCRWSHSILERTEHSVTYLLKVDNIDMDGLDLLGQTATLTCSNFGQVVYLADKYAQFELSEGVVRIIIVDPKGNINATATEEQAAALASDLDSTKTTEDGFTVDYMADGSQVVTYDGNHGIQYVTVTLGNTPVVIPGADPTFKAALNGTWTQSWQLSYQDTSLYWTGEMNLFHPDLTVTGLRISPLSWEMTFTAREPEGDEIGLGLWPKEWDIQFRYQDGSLSDPMPLRRGGSREYSKTEDAGYIITTMTADDVFDQPIDISDVTAVIIDGVEFPLSSK